MRFKLQILLTLCSLFTVGCSDYYELPNTNEPNEVVEWMDGVLSTYYLYNDEYNTMNRNLKLTYGSFLGTTLTKMKTNVLDNKDGSIYSFITRSPISKSGTRAAAAERLNFGLATAAITTIPDSSRAMLAVYAVTPDSPFSKAGICRGDYIVKVNGVTLTSANIIQYANLLQSPTSVTTYTLTVKKPEGQLPEGQLTNEIVTAESVYCTPILKSGIFELDDKRVGYLLYLSFDDSYDDDLMEVMKWFKSEGVTDFILDLRLNGGGSVDSANKLASAIGGVQTLGKTFAKYTYNPTRGGKIVNFKSGWSSYYLGVDKLYCLVSQYSASASELVINSLRGVDFDVVLIGQKTEGKNAAMEVSYHTYGNYRYEFAPITIALSNAKGYGDYADGMDVDRVRDDWWLGYNFADFTEEEVMIWTALSIISGGTGESEVSATTRTRTSDEALVRGKMFRAEGIKHGNIIIQ